MLLLCAPVCIVINAFFISSFLLFFFNETATTEIYTLSLHDALPIYGRGDLGPVGQLQLGQDVAHGREPRDRKSTRLNSSHTIISYAVFCLKKTKKMNPICADGDSVWSTGDKSGL